jgi:NTE family protein
VAFVLSGGASLGAMQVGMLRALIERDIRPDVIVATSVGAVNGAFIASDVPTPSSLDELADLWRGACRGDVFPLEPVTGLLGFLGVRRNLVPGVLPPVEWDGRLLIDGGVVNNTPISHAISLGAQQIYVLPTGAPCTLTAPPRGALAMLITPPS